MHGYVICMLKLVEPYLTTITCIWHNVINWAIQHLDILIIKQTEQRQSSVLI